METGILITDKQSIKEIVKEAIREMDIEKKTDEIILFSVHKVAKMLQRSDRTVKNLIKTGTIQSTPDGKITQTALNEYLSR